jgi:hypothetical protein
VRPPSAEHRGRGVLSGRARLGQLLNLLVTEWQRTIDSRVTAAAAIAPNLRFVSDLLLEVTRSDRPDTAIPVP